MRGTVLKLKRRKSDDCSGAEDDSGEESQNDGSWCDKPGDSSDIQNSLGAESSSQDSNKTMVMSSLELSCSKTPTQAESKSAKPVSTPFKRPVFNWNDASMWKAMSQHPLFSKYMELQSQLNSLFEEIRLDCKKAACEKAFASLLKETSDSTVTYQSVIVQSKIPVEIISNKKRGRPALKKRGRPRKDATTPRKSFSQYENPPSPDSSNGTASPANKHVRKSREQLFLARKPSWTCKDCEKQFSGPGWLERHQSICSIARLTKSSSETVCGIQHTSQIMEVVPSDDAPSSQEVNGRVEAVAGMSDTHIPLSPLRPSHFLALNERRSESPLVLPSQPSIASINPLQPKMENNNHTQEEGTSIKPSNEDLSECPPAQDSSICCGKCKQQFTGHGHLEKHWEDSSACKMHASLNGSGLESVNFAPAADKVSSCKYCGKSFRKHKFLKRHQSLCHVSPKKKIWQCVHCLKGFLRQVQYEQHQAQCFFIGKAVTRETQRCENCSMLFATQKKLLKHQAICCPDSNNHMIQLLKCFKCSMVFPSYKKQLKHRAVCCPDSDTEAMVCHYCLKVFIMRDRMEAHKKKCSKVFVRKV